MQQIGVYCALNMYEHTQLPGHIEMARLLRQPDIQLTPRYRKCPVSTLHYTPPTKSLTPKPFLPTFVYQSQTGAVSVSRRLFARISGQVSSM